MSRKQPIYHPAASPFRITVNPPQHGVVIDRLCFLSGWCPRHTRKRVLATVAGILEARHGKTADDLFGGPQGSPRTDKLVAAAVQWAARIMGKIDKVFSG